MGVELGDEGFGSGWRVNGGGSIVAVGGDVTESDLGLGRNIGTNVDDVGRRPGKNQVKIICSYMYVS